MLLKDITKVKNIDKREAYQSQTKISQHKKKWRIADYKIVVKCNNLDGYTFREGIIEVDCMFLSCHVCISE